MQRKQLWDQKVMKIHENTTH